MVKTVLNRLKDSKQKRGLFLIGLLMLSIGGFTWIIVYRWQSLQLFGIDVNFLLVGGCEELSKYYPQGGFLIKIMSTICLWFSIPVGLALTYASLSQKGIVEFVQRLGLVLVSTLIAVGFSEFVLMLLGCQPGQHTLNQWVSVEDEVRLLPGMTTDSLGIFKFDTAVANVVASELNEADSRIELFVRTNLLYREYAHSLVWILSKYRSAQLSRGVGENEFYPVNPLTPEGFCCANEDHSNKAKSVLLLGDSFTLGHSSSSFDSSFASILEGSGFQVFNSGISGADLPQYLTILRHYSPKVKPDYVVLNFYLGNDISTGNRKPLAGVPVLFNTSAGNVLSFQNGKQHVEVDLAYESSIQPLVIPTCSRFNILMSSLRTTSVLWRLLRDLGLITHCSNEFNFERDDIQLTNNQLLELTKFCETHDTRLIISVIPDLHDGHLKTSNDYPELFAGIDIHEPKMTTEMYDGHDGHFNDYGHRVYAQYLLSIIESPEIQ